MNLSLRNKYIIAIVVQVALLFSLVIFKSITYTQGTPIFLRIEPIDPRDPLRGDYVTLNFEINRVETYGYGAKPKYTVGQTVYVPLIKYYDKYWQANSTLEDRIPANTYGNLYIKGVITDIQDTSIPTPEPYCPPDQECPKQVYIPESEYRQNIRIRYGIEQYFIPENSGNQWDLNQSSSPYALVMVDKEGNAITKQVYVDEKPWPQ